MNFVIDLWLYFCETCRSVIEMMCQVCLIQETCVTCLAHSFYLDLRSCLNPAVRVSCLYETGLLSGHESG
jgi:hypothetical protein